MDLAADHARTVDHKDIALIDVPVFVTRFMIYVLIVTNCIHAQALSNVLPANASVDQENLMIWGMADVLSARPKVIVKLNMESAIPVLMAPVYIKDLAEAMEYAILATVFVKSVWREVTVLPKAITSAVAPETSVFAAQDSFSIH